MKELKRYVRAIAYYVDRYGNDTKGIFIEDTTNEKIRVGKGIFRAYEYQFINKDFIIDTKDTILELAQVGDMVEVYFQGNGTYSKQEIKEITDKSVTLSFQTMTKEQFSGTTYHRKSEEMRKVRNVRALWVRQDDDTFKRYEVKQW